MKRKIMIVMLGLGVMLAGCQRKKPTPMVGQLLTPSDEWRTAYANEPLEDQYLYWTTKILLEVSRQQVKQIVELQQQVKELREFAYGPEADPNE